MGAVFAATFWVTDVQTRETGFSLNLPRFLFPEIDSLSPQDLPEHTKLPAARDLGTSFAQTQPDEKPAGKTK